MERGSSRRAALVEREIALLIAQKQFSQALSRIETIERDELATWTPDEKLDFLATKANALSEVERWEEAAAIYSQILIVEDGFVTRSNRASALWHAGHKDQALEEYRDALAAPMVSSGALVAVAKTLVDIGNEAEAIFFLKKAVELDGEHVAALVALGTLYLRNEQIPEGYGLLRRALEFDPSNQRALELIESVDKHFDI